MFAELTILFFNNGYNNYVKAYSSLFWAKFVVVHFKTETVPGQYNYNRTKNKTHV